MAGLLEIWNDWKKTSGYSTTQQDDFSGLSSDMSPSSGMSGVFQRKGASPLAPDGGSGQIMGINLPQSVLTPKAVENQKKAIEAQKNKTPIQSQMPTDPIVTGGMGTQFQDEGFLKKLSGFIGTDYDKAVATWKDKGGFEGLMANPAFTIGLAFMQAGAQGKTLGQGALNEVIKGAGISQQYKKILDARKEAPIQATAADMAETKDLLGKVGISEGNWFENASNRIKNFMGKGGSKNPGLDYDKAVEEIAVQYQAKVRAKQAQLKRAGKPQILRMDDKIKIMEDLVKSGKIVKDESFFSRLGITDATIQKREHGGPVQAGKPYVVGEAGPEVIIPKSDGNVLTNDDSQIYAMLLAANPQLQKVSKQRAEKILRARFPEYFEG